MFCSDVPAKDEARRGEEPGTPASAAEQADAGPGHEAQIDVARVLDEMRAACRRIRDAWHDASR